MNEAALLEAARGALPDLLALYAFGSRIRGGANAESDLDLAVLVDGKPDVVALWELAEIAGCEVDLIDLRAASTVLQYQVVATGKRLWAKDARAAIYESFILSEKTALDEARAGLLEDIQKESRIHGR